METPEFDPNKKGILFFSRGRGRGHAIPDAQIVDELLKLSDAVDVLFVSYGTGARALEELGHSLIDLGLPDNNPVTDTIILAGKIIGWLKPDLVVAHEEFTALPVAKIFDVPTLFITDWFVEPEKYTMQTLRHADEIVFIDEEGHYEEPEWVKGKVHYVGPILPDFEYTRADRDRAREELGIPLNATLISVLVYPGRRTEPIAPIYDLLMPAFEALDAPNKHLIWNTGDDYDMLVERTKQLGHVQIRHEDPQTDRIMAASDVAVTNGNRNIVLELAALGVPSVTLTDGLNRIDDMRTARAANNVTAKVHEIDHAELGQRLNERWSFGPGADAPVPNALTSPRAQTTGAHRISELVGTSGVEVKVRDSSFRCPVRGDWPRLS